MELNKGKRHETQTLVIGGQRICIHCGLPATRETDSRDYTFSEWYECTCAYLALKEQKEGIEKEMKKIQEETDKYIEGWKYELEMDKWEKILREKGRIK